MFEVPGYKILWSIGAGGTAELFLAERRASALSRLSRQVALKCILPAFSQDPVFRDLFVHEAQVAMQLQHRNIVQVHDLIEVDGRYILVMEYIAGCDLRKVLTPGPLQLDAALFVCTEVLRGLDYAHRQKSADGKALEIVHRDVTPANILISREGEVKLTDFGLARSRDRLGQSSGGVKGTFAFMAPEQAEGLPVDARADLFAAGAVLYTMLTGRSPFAAEGPLAILERIRRADWTPLGIEGVDTLLEQALQANRNARFADAVEMNRAVEALAHASGLRLHAGDLERRVALRSMSLAAPTAMGVGPRKVSLDASDLGANSFRPSMELSPSLAERRTLVAPANSPVPIKSVVSIFAVSALLFIIGWHVWPRVFPREAPPLQAISAVPVPPVLATIASTGPPAPSPAISFRRHAKPGFLTVSADPWAYVFIDGKRRGTTPLRSIELKPGNHELVLENPALGASMNKMVRIASGAHATVIERLSRE